MLCWPDPINLTKLIPVCGVPRYLFKLIRPARFKGSAQLDSLAIVIQVDLTLWT